MKIWLVSELFYPEEVSTGYLMTKIAEEISIGNEIHVICGPSSYQSNVLKTSGTINVKIKIHRISIPIFNKEKVLPRILRMFLLTVLMGLKLIIGVRKNDKVIIVTNPPFLLVFVSFLKKIIRFRYIIIVHDVFPENLVPAGLIKRNSLSYKVLLYIFNSSYKAADKLIVLGCDMGKLMKLKIKKIVPIEVITNWAEHEHVVSLNLDNYHSYYHLPKSADDNIYIQFAGNIGRVQGLEIFINVISKIKKKNFNLIIIGNGARKESLQVLTHQFQLTNIHFFDSKPRQEQCFFLNNMDIGLVTLAPGMYGLGVPSKVYNIFAAGKPVLFIGDEGAEIAEYVKLYNVGWAFHWKQEKQIQSFLETISSISKEEIKLKGENARLLVERKFNQAAILAAYQQSVSF